MKTVDSIKIPYDDTITNSTIDIEKDLEKNNNKCFISLGKCSRLYLYILGSGLFKIFSLILLGSNNISEDGIGLFGFCPIFNSFNFIQSIYIYIGYIIFGIIFYCFKDVDKIFDSTGLKRRKSGLMNNFIHNKPIKNTKKTKIYMFLVCLAFVFYIEIKKVLYIEGFQFFNFWTIEIIFMFLLWRNYFIIDFYRHHKVSIIFNVSICSTLLLTASFLPTSLSGENPGNSYQNLNDKLGNYFYCILFIFVFVILSLIYSFSRIYSKVLMQIKFISPYIIIFLFGITGLFVSLISSIVSYFINYHDNIINYFSALRSVLDEGKAYKFYLEILVIYPLYTFTSFMELTFEILTIYYLNPFYVLMTNNLYYGISEFLSFMLNLSSDGLVITHFILAELSEIFAAFSYMVYLEIIELNFCGLNYNLKKHIILKGEDEFNRISVYQRNEIKKEENDDDSDEENKDENKEYKDTKGLIKSLTKKRYENI